MEARQIVEMLMATNGLVNIEALLDEASVHLPTRGRRWIASFRDETGRQVWRTTGLRDRALALALARRWEAQTKRKRAAQGAVPRKPTLRVRPGSAERDAGLLSQAEVAALMNLSIKTVAGLEASGLAKLRRHPAMRDLWREYTTGGIKEAAVPAPSAWG